MLKLHEGYYKAKDTFYRIVENRNGTTIASDGIGNDYAMSIKYGNFGEADPKIEKMCGLKTYNIELVITFPGGSSMSSMGVLYDEGRKCSMKGFTGFCSLEKINEEEFQQIMNDFDPLEAPPGPFKLQPGKEGKIVWMTGAPGMGKSTSAQLLAKNHGYVYYEADCFMGLKNPYVPLDTDNPSMAQMYQKVLKGPGMEERQAVVKKFQTIFGDIMAGNPHDKEGQLEFYRHMAADIDREKKRIGGDFAIAHVLMTAKIRKFMRDLLGPDLIIVVLTMSSTDRRARVLARHEGDSSSADLMDHFEKMMEGVQENEPNTIDLKVDSSMTREEVVAKIFEKVEELSELDRTISE